MPWRWPARRRHAASVAALVAAVAILLAVGAVWAFARPRLDLAAWIATALMTLLLAFEGMVVIKPSEMQPLAPPDPMEPGDVPILREAVLDVRCGDCGTVFDAHETGHRPLYATCPGCGTEAVLFEDGLAR